MDSFAPQPSEFNPFRRIAAPLHFILVLILLGVLVYFGTIHSAHMRESPNPDRVGAYFRTILQEWLELAFVLLGVWLNGSSLFSVLGERWRSLQQLLRDLGIGVSFLLVSVMTLSLVGPLLGMKQGNSEIQFLLPHGRLETILWFAVAITAGICEEAVYRGYLQRQFMAFTKNAPLGILLPAVAFGLAHSYQGFSRAAVITLGGAMSGILAHWRRTVRPGMFAHTFQDLLALIVKH